MKDWTGNKKSTFVCNGATNHSESKREERDYYATDPIAVRKLCEVEHFDHAIWECACGQGHLSAELERLGYEVYSSDIVDRGYPRTFVYDFLSPSSGNKLPFDIVTNPPYKYALQFVEHAIDILQDGCKVAMFLKLTFLESKSRRQLFEKHPPKTVWVFSERVHCAKNGDFEKYGRRGVSAVAYAWFIWEVGYSGETVVKWI